MRECRRSGRSVSGCPRLNFVFLSLLAVLTASSAFAQLVITGSLPPATVGVPFQAQLGVT